MYFNEKWRDYTWLGNGTCTLVKSGQVIPGLHVLVDMYFTLMKCGEVRPGLVLVNVLELKVERLDLAWYWYMYFNEKWRG